MDYTVAPAAVFRRWDIIVVLSAVAGWLLKWLVLLRLLLLQLGLSLSVVM